MKKYIYMLMAAMPLLFSSCQEEFQPGEADRSDCYGVWFPSQDFSDLIMFDSKEKNSSISVKLSRVRNDGEIVVPVRVYSAKDDYMSLNADSNIEDDIFEVKFEDGQTDAVLNILYMSETLGYESSCRLAIEDPQFAQIYGANRTSVEFTATVVDWKKIITYGDNTASLKNDVFSWLYGAYMITSFDVTLWERTDKPGFFKADGVFSYESMSYMLYGTDSYSGQMKANGYTENASIFIDASDTSKIYIPYQNTGVCLSQMEGYIWIGSNVKENGFASYDEKGYAKVDSEKGTYTFPSLRIDLPDVAVETVNTNGNFTLILPGFEVYDYSVYLYSGESDEVGKLPVDFYLGEHVKTVKYQLFEGNVPEEDIEELAKSVHLATEDYFELKTSSLKIEEGSYYFETDAKISRDTTGIYTIVAVTYGNNKDEIGGYGYTTMTYRAKGDNFPVNCTAGLVVSDKYKAMGYDKYNCVEYFIQGKDLTSVKMGFFRADSYDKNPKTFEKQVANSSSVSRSMLRAINNGGYINMSSADRGSKYVLVVVASNGYQSNTIVARAETAGNIQVEQVNWTIWDAYGASSKREFFKDWEFWALDLTDTLAVRKKIGIVTIADEPNPSTTDVSKIDLDAIKITGMLSGTDYKNYQLDSVLHWNYAPVDNFGGVIYTGSRDYGLVKDKDGYSQFASLAFMSVYGYLYAQDYLMIGVFVADGVIAFVDSGTLASMGAYDECFGMMLGIYADKDRGEFVEELLSLGYMILVDPTKHNTGAAKAAMTNVDKKQIAAYKDVASSVKTQGIRTFAPMRVGMPDYDKIKVTTPAELLDDSFVRTYEPVSFEVEVRAKERKAPSFTTNFEVRR